MHAGPPSFGSVAASIATGPSFKSNPFASNRFDHGSAYAGGHAGSGDAPARCALLMSYIAEVFIDALGVKMRGGALRLQAQYLRLTKPTMVSTEATPLSTSNEDIHNSPPSSGEGKPGMGEHRQRIRLQASPEARGP